MPISEDEYDPRPTYEASSTMSKAELRKTHKPIMEKRRRARINHCLNEIKSLILDAMKKDPARHSKLEKADILEMAVKHLQNVQRQQLALAMATDPSVLRKFKAGFNECADEVNRYISNLEGLDAGIQQRITTHLSKCISGIEQIVHLNFPGFGGVPFLTNTSNIFSSQTLNDNSTDAPGDQNNNPSIQIPQSLQLIPSRLPTGELALLVPNSSSLPYFNQGSSQEPSKQSRPSAFVTVIPKSPSQPPSPPQSPTSTRQDEVPSPKGFRPVNPSAQRLHINSINLVSSTSERGSPKGVAVQTEVKTMRFPIQKFPSPQKLAEPLSIITNQNERYKHAQVLEETAHYEENLQRGVKRKSDFAQTGLLAVASPNKILKTYHDSSVADFRVNNVAEDPVIEMLRAGFHGDDRRMALEVNQGIIDCSFKPDVPVQEGSVQLPSTSRAHEGNVEPNRDMWRPW